MDCLELNLHNIYVPRYPDVLAHDTFISLLDRVLRVSGKRASEIIYVVLLLRGHHQCFCNYPQTVVNLLSQLKDPATTFD